MATNPAAFYEVLSVNIPRFIESALEAAGEDLATDIKARTFPSTAGEGADANGVAIKQGRAYSAAYAQVRQDAGLETNFINFQFSDDLFKSVKNFRTTDGYRIDFNSAEQADKARNLERRYKQEIWAASETEATKALDTFEGLFFKRVQDLAKEFGYR